MDKRRTDEDIASNHPYPDLSSDENPPVKMNIQHTKAWKIKTLMERTRTNTSHNQSPGLNSYATQTETLISPSRSTALYHGVKTMPANEKERKREYVPPGPLNTAYGLACLRPVAEEVEIGAEMKSRLRC